MQTNDLIFDRRHIWHPYTSMIKPLPTFFVTYTEGYYIYLNNKIKLIDGMSSWWSVIHGYNHPLIKKNIKKQINNISHIMFGGITHKTALELCKRLFFLTPKIFECIFLGDSGSVAIEISMKMALQYCYSIGKLKTKFIALRKAYHGDTFGAMSVCDPINSMHKFYHSNFFINKYINFSRNFKEIWYENDDKLLVNIFISYHYKIAAMIIEPIAQGAGGMHFYHPNYLKKARLLCDFYGILLIADEIATGFGRTGNFFAYNYSNITPDILCLGKAITGGNLTFSAIMTSRHISETISNNISGRFMHGSTYMGNPLSCSVANTSISLLECENWCYRISIINEQLKTGLIPLIDHPMVYDVRILGAIGVVETIYNINIIELQNWFVNKKVWIRPFGKLIYLIPPYIISSFELSYLIKMISKSLDIPKNFIIN